MRIHEIYTFVSDSRNGQLLELNASEVAHIKPLHKLYGGDVYRKKVFRDIRALNSENSLSFLFSEKAGSPEIIFMKVDEALRKSNIKPSEFNGIIFPQLGNKGKLLDEMTIQFNHNNPSLCVVNASRTHQTLYLHKGFLTEIAHDAKVTNLPHTFNYLHPRYNLQDRAGYLNHVLETYKGCSTVVLKPTADFRGKGVTVIPYDQIETVLLELLNGGRSRSSIVDDILRDYWTKTPPSIFQIQECAEGTQVQHKRSNWSATTRILWSVVIGDDKNEGRIIRIMPHGGFYKLPRMPLGETGVTKDNTVSYSSARKVVERFTHAFSRAIFGNGANILITDPENFNAEAAPVQAALEKIFSYVDPMGYPALIQHLQKDTGDQFRNDVRARLGREMAHRYRNLNAPRMRARIPVIENSL